MTPIRPGPTLTPHRARPVLATELRAIARTSVAKRGCRPCRHPVDGSWESRCEPPLGSPPKMIESTFGQIAVVLLAAALVGAVTIALKQPLIVGFIGVGILVGPSALGLVGDTEQFELLAQLGIAVLLFLVGLKLDPQLIRTTGPVALATGLGQVLFTSVVGYLIALGLGIDPLPALYVAVALTFSSTIIIVKLLSDKRELDDLHGRIAVGFLIVQDIVV